MEPKTPQQNSANEEMVLRLRKTEEKKVQVVERRDRHFRKTLLIAGAIGALAICIYFLAHVRTAQPGSQQEVSAPGQQAASSQY